MIEREIRIATPDGEMTTFIAHPDGDLPYPVAVLYMDALGYREQIKQNARRFAAAGYLWVPETRLRGVEFATGPTGVVRARAQAALGTHRLWCAGCGVGGG